MEQESLLTEVEFNPVLASTGKRFLNYLIDLIIFYFLIVVVVAGIILNVHTTENTDSYSSPDSASGGYFLFQLIFLAFYILFYCLCEIILKGRTIGKFITGTKAVSRDGSEMSPKTILLRSLSRAVPFEQFSAFGNPCYPWHDKWTDTFVIDVKKTEQNNFHNQ
jgi:uncharacterized RDD family membrane protein YckC